MPPQPWIWTREKVEAMAQSLLEFMQDPEHVFFKQWCVREGIPSQYVTRFAEMSPAFNAALQQADDIQETRLLERGLKGDYHPVIVKLILSSKFGYVERTDLNVTPNPARPVLGSIEDCDRTIQEAQEQRQLLQGVLAAAATVPTAVVGM